MPVSRGQFSHGILAEAFCGEAVDFGSVQVGAEALGKELFAGDPEGGEFKSHGAVDAGFMSGDACDGLGPFIDVSHGIDTGNAGVSGEALQGGGVTVHLIVVGIECWLQVGIVAEGVSDERVLEGGFPVGGGAEDQLIQPVLVVFGVAEEMAEFAFVPWLQEFLVVPGRFFGAGEYHVRWDQLVAVRRAVGKCAAREDADEQGRQERKGVTEHGVGGGCSGRRGLYG